MHLHVNTDNPNQSRDVIVQFTERCETRNKCTTVWTVWLGSTEQRDPDEVEAYVKEFGIDYTIGFVENHTTDAFLAGTEDETGMPPIPQLFIFGRDGRLAEHLIGNSPEHGLDYLDRIITEQLAKN